MSEHQNTSNRLIGRAASSAKQLCFLMSLFALFSIAASAECGGATMRFNITAGDDVLLRNEITAAKKTCFYNFDGRANQTLNIRVETGGTVVFRVYNSAGTEINAPGSGDGRRETYSARLPETGVYSIVVSLPNGITVSPNAASPFQLRVGLVNNSDGVSVPAINRPDSSLIVIGGSQTASGKTSEEELRPLRSETNPESISIKRGQTSTVRRGTLRAGGRGATDAAQYYFISLREGQTLNAQITSSEHAAQANFVVMRDDGTIVEPDAGANDAERVWHITAADNYKLKVFTAARNPMRDTEPNTDYVLTVRF